MTLTEARASVKNSRGDCCAIANGPFGGEIASESARALFGCARMPVRVRKMSPAIPLTAARTVLLSALVAGFIHARNRLTELFLGFYGCCVHRILHGAKDGAAGKGPGLSGRVPLCQLCSRRCKQYTPVHRPLPRYCAPRRHPKEWRRARIFRSSDSD